MQELIDLKGGRTDGLRKMIDWLQSEFGLEKISNKLRELITLSADELVAEVKKLMPRRRNSFSATELHRLKQEHATMVVPLKANHDRSEMLERQLSALVNEAFGLTPEDVKLIQETAPPRMPPG